MPAFARKPLKVLLQEEENGQLHRTLNLFDLTAIGIGGTVGSGVFSVVGSAAGRDCGPSVIIAIILGSLGCLLTGNAYVKLSRAIPSTGSVYAYAYQSLGEVFAVICASCLTLEYALSGSAVAVSWGSKFASAVNVEALGVMKLGPVPVNWAAAMICVPCMLILLQGLVLGKTFSNVMTLLKCAIVIFIIVSSLVFFDASNLSPLVPPRTTVSGKSRYGVDGLFRGTVDCFFAFIGFDEVCCLAGESRDPKKDMPRAVMLSVSGTALFTFLASLGIVGMQHYMDIDPDDGFVEGLKAHGWNASALIISIGELATLPLVVFISFLPQARLFYAMAMDGLMPLIFTRLNRGGVLFWSNIIIGVVCILLALVVDFGLFNDMISAGVLLSFILCNCSLIMLSLTPVVPSSDNTAEASFMIGSSVVESPEAVEGEAGQLSRRRNGTALALYCVCVFACMVLMTGLLLPTTVLGELTSAPQAVRIVIAAFASVFGLVAVASLAKLCCQRYNKKLGSIWIPAAAILFNSFMLATLTLKGFLIITGYFALVLLGYFLYGTRHSASNHREWLRRSLVVQQQNPLSLPEDPPRASENTQPN
mmetsp:Transcript_107527/g.213542  ORF Transcript_107527/g.213542 Transcript_107527/m.213542 type:complete len:591 (-) Transcript_107527:261-2033(-)|eukprot:CAMPEP_0172682472 /NCGR_PEP_ID=MMETSP1074-20121228/18188_1 /TAXON_ID=2916 /ORGANISM="Ceratium fusus, Strain PA161109" /LENGTH=590 /DNA_ID=CAMNT_0013501159 /DNA_START=78 /DNA_END=1850 /DNA_ORIENTATION=-